MKDHRTHFGDESGTVCGEFGKAARGLTVTKDEQAVTCGRCLANQSMRDGPGSDAERRYREALRRGDDISPC